MACHCAGDVVLAILGSRSANRMRMISQVRRNVDSDFWLHQPRVRASRSWCSPQADWRRSNRRNLWRRARRRQIAGPRWPSIRRPVPGWRRTRRGRRTRKLFGMAHSLCGAGSGCPDRPACSVVVTAGVTSTCQDRAIANRPVRWRQARRRFAPRRTAARPPVRCRRTYRRTSARGSPPDWRTRSRR
jgi:hypothetical protein